MRKLIFIFRRPSGSERQQSSLAMRDALRSFSETTEMQRSLRLLWNFGK